VAALWRLYRDRDERPGSPRREWRFG
jgi:hypothetical protein